MPTIWSFSSTVSTVAQWPMQIRQKDNFSRVAIPRLPARFVTGMVQERAGGGKWDGISLSPNY
jgi:hypothetical protein